MRTHLAVVALLGALMSLSSASTLPFDVYRRDDASHSKAITTHAAAADPSQSNAVTLTPTAAPAVCGNGIIERGEDNKQDCCSKCQFRPATFTCRAATSDCDAVEMCTGTSAKCPANKKTCSKSKHSNSTDSASSEVTMCGSVPCSDRDLQCQAQTTSAFSFTSSCAGTKDTPTCQVSCVGTSFTPGSSGDASGCFTLSAFYKDGTKCGQEGACSNGVCTGDKSASFFSQNMAIFAIGGSCVVALIGLCFISICLLRRRKRIENEKEKKEADSYQMSQTMNQSERPKSNIRIGLDPYENGLVDVLSKYEPSSGLGRRPSDSKQQNISARAGYGKGAYPQESLMTEQEMSEALESESHKPLNPTLMTNWPMQPYTLPPIGSAGKSPMLPDFGSGHGSLRKSPSSGNHILYIPPPLPPITLVTSPTNPVATISPYADEAMIVFPPDSPPQGPISKSKGEFSHNKSTPVKRQPQEVHQTNDNDFDSDDDEPSFLQLDNSLTVDRYTKCNAKDRASVSSFFSTLALDPEPEPSPPPPVPEIPPPKLHPSDEFIIPAPVARRAPRPASPMNGAPKQPLPPASGGSARRQRSGTNNIGTRPAPAAPSRVPVMSPDRRREESQVAACFAQDLGFEIVDPSPVTSPRLGKKAVPTGSRVI
ncbi:hypothetical protein MVEG_08558 [Podila verticillata NRRL 6337]|nr:hypothetical protein MVEG_08558 [Podila verticillata NRRL 6337]